MKLQPHSRFILLIAIIYNCIAFAQESENKKTLKLAIQCLNSNDADSAVILADQILSALKDKGNNNLKIRALNVKANALTYISRSRDAIQIYFDALLLCKKPEDNLQIAFIYNELGYLYFELKNYQAAKRYFKEELSIRHEMKEDAKIGHQLLNLASVFRQLQEFDSSQIMLKEVQKILSGISDRVLEASYYNNKGITFRGLNNQDSSILYYKKAEDLFKILKNKKGLLNVLYNTGVLLSEQKKFSSSIEYFKECEKLALNDNQANLNPEVYKALGSVFDSIKEYKTANYYQMRYLTLTDSINSKQVDFYLALLDKRFEASKNMKIIQEQKLNLQESRNNILLMVIFFIVILFGAVLMYLTFSFKRNLNKRIEEAKARFFSNVVHEIRTPLSMIKAPVQYIRNKITDPKLIAQLDIMERNTKRLNELITQMLDISKLESEKYKLNESYGDISEFIENKANNYGEQIKLKDQNFLIQIEKNLPKLFFDKDAIEKIISNLLTNAIKFTPEKGSIGLDMSCVQIQNSLQISFTVWDNGIGISKDEQVRIFDRFYRTPQQEKAGSKGTGIGLSLVKELVNLMNGTITVQSAIQKGTVFSLMLPFEINKQSNNNFHIGNEMVLLVEDDKDILEFNSLMLNDAGYNVISAVNGNEALELLKTELPDVMITDLMMPFKDGLSLLNDIRNNPITDHIPVIILSAKTNSDSKIESITSGAQVYLSKPFEPGELLALIKSQIDHTHKIKLKYRDKLDDKTQTIEERFSGDHPFTKKLYGLIIKYLDNSDITVELLADEMHTHRGNFHRKIKALTGFSPSEILRNVRLEKAKEFLINKQGNVTEAAYSCGFTSQSYFTRCFTKYFGTSPSELI